RVAENLASVQVTVTRGGDSLGTVSVDYATGDRTAVAGSDYVGTAGTLTFAEGVTSQSFNVTILDDTDFEGDETVDLTLGNVSGGELGIPASAILTITEDDPDPQDSNGDGISDAEAIALGLDPNAPDGDTDGDGIADVIELGGDMTDPLDSDVDGVVDALDPGIATAVPVDGGVSVTITTTAGETLTQVGSAAAIDGPQGINFPFGTVSYTTSSPLGGDVTVRMRFTADLPANLLLFKVDNAGGFIELANTGWTQVDSRTIDITLTDGDPLTDLDGVANGSIDDPVAVGSEAAPVVATDSSGGGGGGCTLTPAADKDLTLPLFLLASLGYLYRRRRHRRSQSV
ncbi:MAG: choice-of-anchor U domain-containing protein, partial [Thiogranum sp.]